MSDETRPEPSVDADTGVPFCTEECRQHDGKRCRLLGFRPGNICEPAVVDLVAKLRAAERTQALAHPAAALPGWPTLDDVMRGG